MKVVLLLDYYYFKENQIITMLVLLLLVVLCSTIGDSDARTASVVIPHHGGRSVHQSNGMSIIYYYEIRMD